MVVVKIIDKDELNGKIVWLKKIIMYNGEPRGERIVIERYNLTDILDNGMAPWDVHGDCNSFNQEQAIELFELLQEKL